MLTACELVGLFGYLGCDDWSCWLGWLEKLGVGGLIVVVSLSRCCWWLGWKS